MKTPGKLRSIMFKNLFYLWVLLFILFDLQVCYSQIKTSDTTKISTRGHLEKGSIVVKDSITFSDIIERKIQIDTVSLEKSLKEKNALEKRTEIYVTHAAIKDSISIRENGADSSQIKTRRKVISINEPIKTEILKENDTTKILKSGVKKVETKDATNNKHDENYWNIVRKRVWISARNARFSEAICLLDSSYAKSSNNLIVTENDSLFLYIMGKLLPVWKDSSYIRYLNLEKRSQIPQSPQFLEKKRNFLISQHDSLIMKQTDILHIAELSYYIIKLNDTSANNDVFYNDLILNSISRGRYWEGLEYMDKIDSKMKNEKTDSLRIEIVRKAINSDFSAGNLESLQSKAKKYKKYIGSSFNLRYKYALACKINHSEEEALEEFNWLLNNWQNQNLISWENALDLTNQLYLSTLNIEKSLSLSRRLYTEQKNSNYLRSYILTFRLFFCDVIAQTLMISDRQTLLNFINSGNQSAIPEFLDAGYLTDIKGNLLKTYFMKKDFLRSYEKKDNSRRLSIDFDEHFEKCRYTTKTGKDEYIVFEINSKLNPGESAILNEIVGNPKVPENWINLNAYEEVGGCRFMATLLSEIVCSSLNNSLQLKSFTKILKKRPEIKYLVLYNKNGATESINYDFKLASYPPNYYEKSSKSLAYFIQEVLYNGTKIYELSVPFFNEKIWSGSLRIGVNKL